MSLDHLDERQRALLAKLQLVPCRPGDWTMDMLDMAGGSWTSTDNRSDSIFTIHAITPRHIRNANPTGAGWIAMDEEQQPVRTRDGRPSYLEEFSTWLSYRAACVNLADTMGTGIVNAHLVQSTATGAWSRGLYASSAFLPYGFLSPSVVRLVTEEYISRILQAEHRGLVLQEARGIVGFGALSGSRVYANRIPDSSRWKAPWQYTLGNFATGGAVVHRLLPALAAKTARLERTPTVLLVGATGSTGMVVSALLADSLPVHLVLCSRTERDLVELEHRLTSRTPGTTISWCTADRLTEQVPMADVVVYLVSDPSFKVPAHLYRPGALVIDAARPRCHDEGFPDERADLVITDGPTILMRAGEVVYDELFDLFVNELLCCMAETAYRAVARDYDNRCPPARVADFNQATVIDATTTLLSRMAAHGFDVAGHDRWHRQVFDQLERLRMIAA